MKPLYLTLAAIAAAAVTAHAQADVQITEIMYTGLFGEFVEITNGGNASQNMTGWKFSDNARGLSLASVATATDISGIGGGTLAAGDSAIITEVSSTIFIQAWYTEASTALPSGFTGIPANRIVQNNAVNLGRTDEVNIYANGAIDGVNDFVDRVTYTDQGGASADKGPRSEDVSAVPSSNNTAATFSGWQLSSVGTGAAWKAGVQGSINGRPIPGPVGSPGVWPNL
ncbi:lamin tail domain-containing protein [Luteolibacter algae]|uniref:Lamin tail domain-containing protein n=1 Tax=Luteolibacter algae TaxID=454151 RepID=A0ABW5D8T5_9BACT